MSSNGNQGAGDGQMEVLNVRVPTSLLDQVDEVYDQRGYASRSEAVRDALRDWVGPAERGGGD